MTNEEQSKYECYHNMEVEDWIHDTNPELEILPEFNPVQMSGLFSEKIDYDFTPFITGNFTESVWLDGARRWSTGVPHNG